MPFWNDCRSVRQMKLKKIQVQGGLESIQERLETTQGLQEIEMHLKPKVVLLKLCPNLRSFRWKDEYYDSPPEMIKLLRGRCLRTLESFHGTDPRNNELELASCLRTIDHVKEISFSSWVFGDTSFDAPERHFAMLEHVSLGYNISSEMTQTILE
jgi:hypothetical protein